MDLWKGAFSPIVKHVNSVGFIPIEDMTEEDWAWLDYGNLDPATKASIDRVIYEEGLDGFFIVKYDMHKVHGGKEKYYYPATAKQAEQFQAGEVRGTDFQSKADFTNGNESRPLQSIDSAVIMAYGFGIPLLIEIISYLYDRFEGKHYSEQVRLRQPLALTLVNYLFSLTSHEREELARQQGFQGKWPSDKVKQVKAILRLLRHFRRQQMAA